MTPFKLEAVEARLHTLLFCRALPDITSGREVRQIVKIRTVRKLDNFLSGRRTVKDKKKKIQKKIENFSFKIFLSIFWFIYLFKRLEIQVCIQSSLAGPVRQIWVSGPVGSGKSYALSGRALIAAGLLALLALP